MLRKGQGKANARSRRGQGKVKVRSRQRKLNCNYNLMGFDTNEINLVLIVSGGMNQPHTANCTATCDHVLFVLK